MRLRKPQHSHNKPRRIAPVEGVDYQALAERVSYEGSPEHKRTPSYAGHPRPKANGSICPITLSADRSVPDGWLKEAVRRRCVDGTMSGSFPKQVWYKDGDIVFEGYLINRDRGTYKGYPLDPEEWPPHIEGYYE